MNDGTATTRWRFRAVCAAGMVAAATAVLSGCGPPDEGSGDDTGLADTGGSGDTGAVTDTGSMVDADGADASGDAADDGEPDRRRIVIKGIDFVETNWSVTGGDRVVVVRDEEADGGDGRTAGGTVAEPFERDIVYVWGGITSIEVDGTSRVLVDGEIRRNGPEILEREPPGDRPPIEMTLHSSIQVLRTNGRVSERMVARYAARAFEEAGYGYEVVYNLVPEQPPDEKSNCSAGDAPQWWRDRVQLEDVPVLRKDANVLMLDANGGGCGAIAGKYGTTPARNIDEAREWTEVGHDDWHRNMHGTLHEIGHQLGARHDHVDEQEGRQHWGSAWIAEDDDGEMWWHRTPNVAGNGAPNFCGDMIEQRQRDTEAGAKRHQVYAECATERFVVVDLSSDDG